MWFSRRPTSVWLIFTRQSRSIRRLQTEALSCCTKHSPITAAAAKECHTFLSNYLLPLPLLLHFHYEIAPKSKPHCNDFENILVMAWPGQRMQQSLRCTSSGRASNLQKKKHTYIWRTIWDVLDLCRKLDTLFSVNGWRQNGNDFQPRRVCVELLQRSAAAENSREIAGIRVISISVAAASFKCNFQLRKLSGRDCKFKTSGPTSTSTKSYVARCLFLLAVMTSCKAPRTLQLIKALGKICHSFKDKLRN